MFRSIRPAVLLALVVAVACTDQPTEPTAGSPIRTTLPPPPAEASVLTGTLGGGDGTGVSAELGYYESPVYSTVTVSGSLSYSGRPDGYLPGSGQIDAAGIQLSNQCDLTVYISWALPTIGSTTTIAPTCWYPARNQGPYSRRMVLAGRIFTYRTYGPPLSCWKYPAPCVSYQGTQTVTVTPEEGNLIVTPSATEVGPGGEIGFTAKAVWAGDGKTAVPLTIREWRWQGSGREVGGGHTTICDPADSNPCWVRVYQSGTVTLEAVVNGKVKTQSVAIEVVGGGDGGCDGSPSGSLQLADCQEDPDSIILSLTLSNSQVLPVIEKGPFNAVTQVTLSGGLRVPRTDYVTVRVEAKKKSTGEPMPGVHVAFASAPVERSGGHVHAVHDRPKGTFLEANDNVSEPAAGHRGQWEAVTGVSGAVELRYRSSGLGGQEWVVARGNGAPLPVRADSGQLTVRFPGLVEMARNGGALYQFKSQVVGSRPSQRNGENNNWVRAEFRDSLVQVFTAFFASGGRFTGTEPQVFLITDAGLPYGGLTDAGDSDALEWRSPHLSHRTGNDADIRDQEGGRYILSPISYEKLIAACWPSLTLNMLRVQRCDMEPPPDDNPPHIHIEGLR